VLKLEIASVSLNIYNMKVLSKFANKSFFYFPWRNVSFYEDFDECPTNFGKCSSFAQCTNLEGTFSCACKDSYYDSSTNGVGGTVCGKFNSFWCLDKTFLWERLAAEISLTLGTLSNSGLVKLLPQNKRILRRRKNL